ncbi:sigma-54 dependent transcriptional regulator [Microaerobacter geothermalis]|uniref:sigma-54-dependent transcriptional regulator n=1 Tax=Microaerobacter geothermalis TaxID=674972 RepID=UPI001F4328E2|nr:sigma-54 dependent transcriptional regulator [Microaerobacter geothermalis]MCF6092775.1 sigma-54 dependent transcriptional regulator [Microaerobacter geothermalis]
MLHKVLIIDDEKNMRWILEEALKNEFEVKSVENGELGLEISQSFQPDLILLDDQLPRKNGLELLPAFLAQNPDVPIIMMTAYATVENAVKAIKIGAVDYLTKPFHLNQIKEVIKRNIGTQVKQQPVIIGESKIMKEIIQQIRLVAPTDSTVLVSGESGTGKELVAKELHQKSNRKDQPFVTVNCAAIPENLMESELFGHVKGAFTGAVSNKKGFFQLANGGTLFLDEIGEMPYYLQAKLLRVLQEKSFYPVGSDTPISVDVRIVAATNRDLHEEVELGNFRMDLFYRLNVFPIHLPPLRKRKEDILTLAHHFLDRYKRPYQLDEETKTLLTSYEWPGNIRELQNCMERMFILSQGGEITKEHVPPEIKNKITHSHASFNKPADEASLNLEEHERELIENALMKTKGNQSQAAKLLGITRYTLLYRMKKYQILK